MSGLRKPHRFGSRDFNLRPRTESSQENESENTTTGKRKEIKLMDPAKKISKNDSNNNTNNDTNNDKNAGYMLLRILGRIYCLNQDEIPESGMLRTLYEMNDNKIEMNDNKTEDKTIDIHEDWFTTEQIDMFFHLYKDKKIIGDSMTYIAVSKKNYSGLLKIANYFQIDEKKIARDICLHWIYKYSFSNYMHPYNDKDKVEIFFYEYNDIELLSIKYKDTHMISPFTIKFCETIDDEIINECVVIENSKLIICALGANYYLYIDGIRDTQLKLTPRTKTETESESE